MSCHTHTPKQLHTVLYALWTYFLRESLSPKVITYMQERHQHLFMKTCCVARAPLRQAKHLEPRWPSRADWLSATVRHLEERPCDKVATQSPARPPESSEQDLANNEQCPIQPSPKSVPMLELAFQIVVVCVTSSKPQELASTSLKFITAQ